MPDAASRPPAMPLPSRAWPVPGRWRPAALAALAALCGLACAGPAQADETDPAVTSKLTAGAYAYGGSTGTDVNLRWQRGDAHAWLGAYRDRDFGSQARAGLDTSWQVAPLLALQPSLQVATRGFVGGSLTAQVGGDVFGLLGWGRTNLRPYFNLNFDPNDATTVGLGWRGAGDQVWTLTQIADDRLHTGQRHTHLNARLPDAQGRRWTVDLLHKRGQGDAGWVDAWGASVGVDWPRWFVRLAHDPAQNFSPTNATRLSAGLRW